MNGKVKALAEYILLNKDNLNYYTNEDGYEFVARNLDLFKSYKKRLTYEYWVEAAKVAITELPEKIRQRHLPKEKNNKIKIEMERDTGAPFHFTIIYEKEHGDHLLVLQPVNGTENEKVIIKINEAIWESMQNKFGMNLDPVAQQTQVFKKEG